MRFERLNNLPCNAIKLNFVAIFVFFCNSRLFYQNIFLLSDRGETGSHLVSLWLLGGE